MRESMLRPPKNEELPALRALWLQCFPEDGDGFCDEFLSQWFRPDRCLVLADEAGLRSMVHFFTARLLRRGTPCGTYLYLYAIGTAPAFRRQGNLRQLLEGCRTLAESRGLDGILLTSAEGLEPLYERYGMQPCAVRYEQVLTLPPAEPIAWEPCGYDRYASARQAYLAARPAAFEWLPESDRFIYEVQRSSGDIVSWQEAGREYYAVLGTEEDIPTLLETDHPLTPGFPARIAATLGLKTLKVCSPEPLSPDSRAVCFGHCLPGPPVTDAYLNLIAD